jgi:hypothetical protein
VTISHREDAEPQAVAWLRRRPHVWPENSDTLPPPARRRWRNGDMAMLLPVSSRRFAEDGCLGRRSAMKDLGAGDVTAPPCARAALSDIVRVKSNHEDARDAATRPPERGRRKLTKDESQREPSRKSRGAAGTQEPNHPPGGLSVSKMTELKFDEVLALAGAGLGE